VLIFFVKNYIVYGEKNEEGFENKLLIEVESRIENEN